ncbi:DinB family protein [Mycolicibacterium sp. XJ1819]
MPGMPPPAPDERQSLLEFLNFQQNAFFATAYGLTDEQARATPSVSSLSIGGLVKHAAGVQKGWTERAAWAPELPPKDDRPMAEVMAEYADQYVMRDDETLEQLLDGLKTQSAETLRVFAAAELTTPVPVPPEVPWFPQDVGHWSVRWVILHLVEELSRHAGHADIIRESLDGATMYELIAAHEQWPETEWIKRWRPAGGTVD